MSQALHYPMQTIPQLRDSHHRIAQMFAMGLTPGMVRHQTGMSIHRLNRLLDDPTFQELISSYAEPARERLALAQDAFTDLAVANMLRAESQIADHLDAAEDSGDLLPLDKLDKIAQGRADRFGYSKHTRVEHTHDFAAALDKAISRSGKGEEMKTIEATATPMLPQPLPTERSSPPASSPVSSVGKGEGRASAPRSPPASFAGVLKVRRRLG